MTVLPLLLLLLAPLPAGTDPTPPAAAAGMGQLAEPFVAEGLEADDPPDHEFDFLLVEFGVDVSSAGRFLVSAELEVTGSASRWYHLEAGLHRVQVPIQGFQIWESGVDGPYTVHLTLQNETFELLDTRSFETDPFSAQDFEGPDADFAGDPQDGGVDTDGDGLYDFLALDVPLTVREAGGYRVQASAFDLGEVANYSHLPPGDATVRLLIPGHRLREAGVSGELWLSLGMNRLKFDGGWATRSYTTAPYEAEAFEALPTLEVEAGDAGRDTDEPPDGTFDVLRLTVNVTGNVAGDHRLVAFLRVLLGPELERRETVGHLPASGGPLAVDFSRIPIVAKGLDGPFNVTFTLYDPVGRRAEGTHATGTYAWTDFDPLPLEATGAVEDAYVDADDPPDGVLDDYRVRVPVQVRDGGTYALRGILAFEDRPSEALELPQLSPGAATVELAWPLGFLQGKDPGDVLFAEVSVQAPGEPPFLLATFQPSPLPDGAEVAPPPLAFVGGPTVSTPDDDGDGLLDAVEVAVAVEVARPGPYAFQGLLGSAVTNDRVAFAQGQLLLPQGSTTISLAFPGWALRASLRDGPYQVLVLAQPGFAAPPPGEHRVPHRISTGGYTPPLFPHQFDGDPPRLRAACIALPPVPDGALEPGEWAPATAVDLTSGDPGAPATRAYLANDREHLYVALEVLGDRTQDPTDAVALAFDAGRARVPDRWTDFQLGTGFALSFREGEFLALQGFTGTEGPPWFLQSPLDRTAPARATLAAVRGFGPSDLDAGSHRVYEFRIPRTMLPAGAGEPLGFAVHSTVTRGIYDGSGPGTGWPLTIPPGQALPLHGLAHLVLAGTGGENEPPTLTLTDAPADLPVRGPVVLRGVAVDCDGAVQRVEVQVDDGPWTPAQGTASWRVDLDAGALPDGPRTVRVRAFDGVAYSDPVEVDLFVDSTAPALTLETPAPDAVLTTSSVTLEWTAEDATSGLARVEVVVDGGPPVSVPAASGSYTLSGLGDGPHEVLVRAVDRAGNEATARVAFVVDTNPLSPTGPHGPLPLVGIASGAAAAAAAAVWTVFRRRSRVQPPLAP